MTLGGLAVAIGSAVDDAIDAENVYRSLRENNTPNPRPVLDVVFEGCQEVLAFGATIITIVVFSPVFALAGVEGSIFKPMHCYLVAVLASSVIALTVTPALCVLLPTVACQKGNPGGEIFKRLYHPFKVFSASFWNYLSCSLS